MGQNAINPDLYNQLFYVERLCPHNQRSHGLCDDIGQCPDPGHQCITTDDDQSVCCNKNQPTPVCTLPICNPYININMYVIYQHVTCKST